MSTAALGLHWNGEVDAGELLVGVGTLLLAAATTWLARQTGADVRESRASVELAERNLEVHDWPFLVARPEHPTFAISPTYDRDTGEPSGGPEWRCDVELVNYGRGPAIMYDASLRDRDGREFVSKDWEVDWVTLPEQDPELVGIGMGTEEPPPEDHPGLVLRLFYRSATGVKYETAHRLKVGPEERAVRLDVKQNRIGP